MQGSPSSHRRRSRGLDEMKLETPPVNAGESRGQKLSQLEDEALGEHGMGTRQWETGKQESVWSDEHLKQDS